MKTIVGLFSTSAAAQDVKQMLVSDGYNAGDMKIVAKDHNADFAGTEHEESGVGEKITHFFKSLTGGDEDVHNHYASGVNTGGALLTVKVDDEDASVVADLLRQNGARDIEGDTARTSDRAMGNATGDYAAANTMGETSIPVVEESLVVGKREVDRGGVRVYSHVVEQPVSEDVTLRDENILVERRPVDRAATAEDFNPGDRSFEIRATGEEAVVGKTARVVEEVLVGKDSSQRTEAIHDSVRRTEVEVEELAGTETAGNKRSY